MKFITITSIVILSLVSMSGWVYPVQADLIGSEEGSIFDHKISLSRGEIYLQTVLDEGVSDPEIPRIREATQLALSQSTHLVVKLFNVVISEIHREGTWAIVLLELYDKETNESVPTEPGIAIAWFDEKEQKWQVALQGDEAWRTQVSLAPTNLLSEDFGYKLRIRKNRQIEPMSLSREATLNNTE